MSDIWSSSTGISGDMDTSPTWTTGFYIFNMVYLSIFSAGLLGCIFVSFSRGEIAEGGLFLLGNMVTTVCQVIAFEAHYDWGVYADEIVQPVFFALPVAVAVCPLAWHICKKLYGVMQETRTHYVHVNSPLLG